jgi:DNA-binding Lrp family transcriptional regulator
MKYAPCENTNISDSMARIYRVLDKKIRYDLLNILRNEGPMPFNFISEALEIDRAKMAYHIRILKEVNLIENYYDKMENVKNHSFYRLTGLGQWILTHDLRLLEESKRFSSDRVEQNDVENEQPIKAEDINGIKIIEDPRIRQVIYKVRVKTIN